jgi:hypothetical protein
LTCTRGANEKFATVNNLAVCFAQHPAELPILTTPGTPAEQTREPPAATADREQHLQSAANWANNAHTHAVDVQGEDRTPECDEACAVSLCTLGDIALLLGKPAEARGHFEKSVQLSRELEFAETLERARSGLEEARSRAS